MLQPDGRPSLFMPQVMALLNEHAAAALQYGIDRKFENETKNVLLYDMGANSVRASVEQYSAYKGKDRGRSAVISQFQTTGVRWDDQLGGQAMEGRLVEHFADEFNHKVRRPTSRNARMSEMGREGTRWRARTSHCSSTCVTSLSSGVRYRLWGPAGWIRKMWCHEKDPKQTCMGVFDLEDP